MRLHTAGKPLRLTKPVIGKVTLEPLSKDQRSNRVLVASAFPEDASELTGYAGVVVSAIVNRRGSRVPVVHSVKDLDHLKSDYVVVLEPNGFVRTLYRPDSAHNTLFATERCNSNCLMCSQPPSDRDDVDALTQRNLRLIDLISPPPEYLCITGGEPTLLGERLLVILRKLKDVMAGTHVHILTNGRRFAWPDFTSDFARVKHPNLSVGIPLYSDDAATHDYVVQARDAFDQTILGMHQLARYQIEIEVRVVLHALTTPRLVQLSEYVCRNLTFVDHVAFMGMEHIGYAPRNMHELWIDPIDYQDKLEDSVRLLARFGIDVRIYNLQLCVLNRSLWKFAKQAISDWKNTYSEPCVHCSEKERCGGFFQWPTKLQSRGIHAISNA
jgi:His-Xaa-Ser system radical SAM maturase HxsC